MDFASMFTNVSNALGFAFTLVTAQVTISGQDLNCLPSLQPESTLFQASLHTCCLVS